MHLFEAFFAWESISRTEVWRSEIDKIAALCLTRFIDQETGMLREFFNNDWQPMSGDLGKIVEPGHLFEWAWLLTRWGKLRGNEAAIFAAKKLFELGKQHGIDQDRQVVVLQLNDDFSVLNSVSRLWPHTELIKAATLLAKDSRHEDKKSYEEYIVMGIVALEKFFDVEPKGLWRDKLKLTGKFELEPVPASSFYHIVCALSVLFEHYLQTD